MDSFDRYIIDKTNEPILMTKVPHFIFFRVKGKPLGLSFSPDFNWHKLVTHINSLEVNQN